MPFSKDFICGCEWPYWSHFIKFNFAGTRGNLVVSLRPFLSAWLSCSYSFYCFPRKPVAWSSLSKFESRERLAFQTYGVFICKNKSANVIWRFSLFHRISFLLLQTWWWNHSQNYSPKIILPYSDFLQNLNAELDIILIFQGFEVRAEYWSAIFAAGLNTLITMSCKVFSCLQPGSVPVISSPVASGENSPLHLKKKKKKKCYPAASGQKLYTQGLNRNDFFFQKQLRIQII